MVTRTLHMSMGISKTVLLVKYIVIITVGTRVLKANSQYKPKCLGKYTVPEPLAVNSVSAAFISCLT